jgi:hypothetical protein
VPEGLDQREGLEGPAHIHGHLLAFQIRRISGQLRHQHGELLAHQFHGLGLYFRVLVGKKIGHLVEGLGHVLHAKVGYPLVGNAVFLLHHLGELHGRPGALHQIERRAVTAPDVVHPCRRR